MHLQGIDCDIDGKKYNQHEVNVRIIQKQKHPRHEYDLLLPIDLYRDEYISCYSKAKTKFREAVTNYRRANERSLATSKGSLCETENSCNLIYNVIREARHCKSEWEKDCGDFGNGILIRKRTVRHIHSDLEVLSSSACSIEPWFKRYLILSRFIKIARGLILKRRLLSRLDVLKHLSREDVEALEGRHKKCENVSYGDLFERFIM